MAKQHQAPRFYWIVRKGSEEKPGPCLWLPHSRTHRWTTSDHLAMSFMCLELACTTAARVRGFVVTMEREPLPTDALAMRMRADLDRFWSTANVASSRPRIRRKIRVKKSAPAIPDRARAARRRSRVGAEKRAGRAESEAA